MNFKPYIKHTAYMFCKSEMNTVKHFRAATA